MKDENIENINRIVSNRCDLTKCSMCDELATHKVGEEIPFNDLMPFRNRFSAYVCCKHFRAIFGCADSCSPENLGEA